MEQKLHTSLQTHFGQNSFLPGQLEIIHLLLPPQSSALAVFPTGGGKSLCYQLPAVLLEGLTIVVSPLVALMLEQVATLRGRGIECDMIGTCSDTERAAMKIRVSMGITKILFLTPEQVTSESTRLLISFRTVSLVAIDEAHCISEWGHTFRPHYLRLAGFVEMCKAERVVCLTATATEKVAADICRVFSINSAHCIRTPFHRPNLHLDFHFSPQDEPKRLEKLGEVLAESKELAIVYVTTQRTSERVARYLTTKCKIPAMAYHAGLHPNRRCVAQDWFMGRSENAVIVATIAFGMGIDKNDIRRVIHFNLPKSLEGYVQEIGRAGRDGLIAKCDVLVSPRDVDVLEFLFAFSFPSARAVLGVLRDFFHGEGPGAVKVVRLEELGRAHDMPENTVNLLLAFLSMYHGGCVEMLSQVFTTCDVQPKNFLENISALLGLLGAIAEPDGIGAALAQACVIRKTWGTVNVENVKGFEARAVMAALEGCDAIISRPSGRAHSFLIKSVPQDLEAVARLEYERFLAQEKKERDQLQMVVNFVSARSCHVRILRDYFGDPQPKHFRCETCRGCRGVGETNNFIHFETAKPPDVAQLKDALQDIPKTEGARFATKFLFGVKSPLMKKKFIEKKAFGMCRGKAGIQAVLAACEVICGRRDRDFQS